MYWVAILLTKRAYLHPQYIFFLHFFILPWLIAFLVCVQLILKHLRMTLTGDGSGWNTRIDKADEFKKQILGNRRTHLWKSRKQIWALSQTNIEKYKKTDLQRKKTNLIFHNVALWNSRLPCLSFITKSRKFIDCNYF